MSCIGGNLLKKLAGSCGGQVALVKKLLDGRAGFQPRLVEVGGGDGTQFHIKRGCLGVRAAGGSGYSTSVSGLSYRFGRGLTPRAEANLQPNTSGFQSFICIASLMLGSHASLSK